MIGYTVLVSEKPEDLCDQVHYWSAQGWELQGGVSITHSTKYSKALEQNISGLIYAQAMTTTNVFTGRIPGMDEE